MASILNAGGKVLGVVTSVADSLSDGAGALNDFVTQQRKNQQVRYTAQSVHYQREVILTSGRRALELEEETAKFVGASPTRAQLFAEIMERSEAAFAVAAKNAPKE